jgi:hypothetical protein
LACVRGRFGWLRGSFSGRQNRILFAIRNS